MFLASTKFFHTSRGPLIVTYTGATSGVWNFEKDGTNLYLPVAGTYTFTFNRVGDILVKGVSAGGNGNSGRQESIYGPGGGGGGGGAAHFTGVSVTTDASLTYAGRVGAGGSVVNTEFQIQSSTFFLKLTAGGNGGGGSTGDAGSAGAVIVGTGGIAGGGGGVGAISQSDPGPTRGAGNGSSGACGGGGGGGASDGFGGGGSGASSSISGSNTSGGNGGNGSGNSPGSGGSGGSGVLFNGVYYGGGGGGGGGGGNASGGSGGAGKQGILVLTYVS
jgi:hypothetical protein